MTNAPLYLSMTDADLQREIDATARVAGGLVWDLSQSHPDTRHHIVAAVHEGAKHLGVHPKTPTCTKLCCNPGGSPHKELGK